MIGDDAGAVQIARGVQGDFSVVRKVSTLPKLLILSYLYPAIYRNSTKFLQKCIKYFDFNKSASMNSISST